MFDYVVVGGGIGGVLCASLLSHMGKEVVLIEAQSYLGGCAGTFQRKGFYYNAGASTLVGLEEHMPVGRLMKFLGLEPPAREIDPSMVVHIGDSQIKRYRSWEDSLAEIEKSFPQLKHRAFWERVRAVSQNLWSLSCDLLPYPGPSSPIRALLKHPLAFLNTVLCHFVSSRKVARLYLGEFNSNYESFLNHHTLITAQGYMEEVPFSVASLGLTYPNLTNYYAVGGMGRVVESFASRIKHVRLKERVLSIESRPGGFLIKTTLGEYEARRVILNTTIWDAGNLVRELKPYSERARERYRKMWGAFVIYITLEDRGLEDLSHHHFILLDRPIPYTGSRSLFLSLSEREDPILSKDGTRSVTVSTHTHLHLWEGLSPEEYKEKKQKAIEYCMEELYRYIPSLRHAKKLVLFAGTPKTFKRFTLRYRGSVGGLPVLMDYFPFNFPPPLTPVKNLYIVGDTVFPGQGWPGVALGVINLLKLIEKDIKVC